MSEQNDETQNFALMAVAAVITLVLAGVLTLAASTGLRSPAKVPAAAVAAVAAAPASAASVASGADEPLARIYFELDSPAVPASAKPLLDQVVEAARQQSDKVVLISGFHDASGDAAANAALSKGRAEAVRQALQASGIAASRLVLDKPAVTDGGADARQARRVELRLR